MKKEKKYAWWVITFIGTILFIAPACQKYPDGPQISFRSKTERVTNTWKVDKYIENGNDFTSQTIGYTETYTKDGNYSYLDNNHSGTGIWNFQSGNKEIQLIGTSHLQTRVLYILRLEEKEFWYYYIDGSDHKEFHMIPN
ncbi:MAG TPA: hypothetical protein VKG26_08980 [Bacteroidia bacterium]|nr:hypothetical protein [Bacteroidia bacterium]